MIIYLAGKMTGLTDFGRTHFYAADKALTRAGHSVLNPAALPSDLPRESYLPITLAMLNAADAIFLLIGHAGSSGAMIEHQFARYQHKKIFHEDNRHDCEVLGIEAETAPHSACICGTCVNYSGINTALGDCTFTGDTRTPYDYSCTYYIPKEKQDQ